MGLQIDRTQSNRIIDYFQMRVLQLNAQMESSPEDRQVVYKLKCITIISLIFMTVQIVGGLLAHSVAILADAFHLLSDVLAYVISLQAVHYSYKIPPKFMTFGYEKLQPLGALLNVAIIWFVTLSLLMEATQRILHKDIVEEPLYMLLTSFFGLACNLYIMKVLHSDQTVSCPHSHTFGHDHHHHGSHGHHHHDHSHDSSCSHNHQHDHNAPALKNNKQMHQIEHEHEIQHTIQTHHHQYFSPQSSQQIHEHAQIHCSQDHTHSPIKCKQKSEYQSIQIIHDEHPFENQEFHDDHSLSDQQQERPKSIFQNLNLEAAYVHIISDIILSIGVIISALVIYLKADPTQWSYWHLADPFCTYLFSFVALYSTISITKSSTIILLDGCDDPQLIKRIQKALKNTKQITQIQQVKVWSMNRQKYYGIIKIKVERANNGAIKGDLLKRLQKYGVQFFIDIDGGNHIE